MFNYNELDKGKKVLEIANKIKQNLSEIQAEINSELLDDNFNLGLFYSLADMFTGLEVKVDKWWVDEISRLSLWVDEKENINE